jgi:hypothetical protein
MSITTPDLTSGRVAGATADSLVRNDSASRHRSSPADDTFAKLLAGLSTTTLPTHAQAGAVVMPRADAPAATNSQPILKSK